MCGTEVRKNSSTSIRPRAAAVSPARSRFSSAVAPWRPAEYMTVSAGIFFPLSRIVIAPVREPLKDRRSTAATVSPNRNGTARSRRWYLSASTISRSQNSSMRSRRSTTVTLVPRAANIEAYSMPITPAPTTTMVCGRCSRLMMPSESMMVDSSNSTVSGRAGCVPVAMMILSAVKPVSRPVSGSSTSMVCGSVKRAVPSRSVLDGMVPVLMHTPPIMFRRSTIATRRPSLAAAIAAFCPPGPEPRTSTSKSYTPLVCRAAAPRSSPLDGDREEGSAALVVYLEAPQVRAFEGGAAVHLEVIKHTRHAVAGRGHRPLGHDVPRPGRGDRDQLAGARAGDVGQVQGDVGAPALVLHRDDAGDARPKIGGAPRLAPGLQAARHVAVVVPGVGVAAGDRRSGGDPAGQQGRAGREPDDRGAAPLTARGDPAAPEQPGQFVRTAGLLRRRRGARQQVAERREVAELARAPAAAGQVRLEGPPVVVLEHAQGVLADVGVRRRLLGAQRGTPFSSSTTRRARTA